MLFINNHLARERASQPVSNANKLINMCARAHFHPTSIQHPEQSADFVVYNYSAVHNHNEHAGEMAPDIEQDERALLFPLFVSSVWFCMACS
jgi:hypothetical protein